jgi:hypothetical protein
LFAEAFNGLLQQNLPGPDPPTLRHRLREAILEPTEWQLNVVVGLNKAYNNRDRLKGNLL